MFPFEGTKANTIVYFSLHRTPAYNIIPLQRLKTKNVERGKEEVYVPINNIIHNH